MVPVVRTRTWRLAILLVLILIGSLPAHAVPSGIEIDLQHFLLRSGADGGLDVKEQIILVNLDGEIPAGAGRVSFDLPKGATNVQVADKNKDGVVVRDGKVVVTGPVPTGESNYGFSYTIPAGGAPHFLLNLKAAYLTDVMYFLVPANSFIVTGEGLLDGGIQEMGPMQFQLYVLEGVQPGEEFNLVVTPVAGTATGGSGGSVTVPPPRASMFHNPGHIRFWMQSPFRRIDAHLFLGIVVLIPVSILVYYLRNRKQQRRKILSGPAKMEEEAFQRLLAKEKVLLAKLGDLEIQQQSGAVNQEEYTRLREAYKTKLVEVKKRLRELTD